MEDYYKLLQEDIRFEESLSSCMNCGICTAICPAAEFYHYDPRQICNLIQSRDNSVIEGILKSETIWYCGQCMSCKLRCPRANVPGMLISSLRKLSTDLGFFAESEKGRQQFAIKRVIGENILNTGYCIHVDSMDSRLHPEQGPIFEWYRENVEEVADKLGANYNKYGCGALRKISEDNLIEIRKIFEVTGGIDFFDNIEEYSKTKANDMKLNFSELGADNEYFYHTYLSNSENHQK